MAHSRLYRNFLILQEEEKGYSTSSDRPLSGYAKLEGKGDRCRISFYAQNLKKDNYHMMLICNKKGIKQNILLDTMNINEQGKAEVIKEYNANDIANSKIGIDKVTAAALVKLLDSGFSVVMLGVMSGEKLPEGWQAFEISPMAIEPQGPEEIQASQEKCENETPIEILPEQQRNEALEESSKEFEQEAQVIEETKEAIKEEEIEELNREKEAISVPEEVIEPNNEEPRKEVDEASSQYEGDEQQEEKEAQQEMEVIESLEAPRDAAEPLEDINVIDTQVAEIKEEDIELPPSAERETPEAEEGNIEEAHGDILKEEQEAPETEAVQEKDMNRQSEEISEELQEESKEELQEESKEEPQEESQQKSQEGQLLREGHQEEPQEEEQPLGHKPPEVEQPIIEESPEEQLPREEPAEDSEEIEDELQAEGEDFLARGGIAENNFEEYEKTIEESKANKSKRNEEEDFALRGSVAQFFESVAQGFEEVRGVSKDIKYCKWYKVKVDNLDTLLNINDYNKYTIAYYPMMNYYPYFRSHGHFLLGYKCDPNGSVRYLIYGVPGRKNIGDQPYGGKSGFVTWIPSKDGGDLGYWIMFYDFKNSIIVVPMK